MQNDTRTLSVEGVTPAVLEQLCAAAGISCMASGVVEGNTKMYLYLRGSRRPNALYLGAYVHCVGVSTPNLFPLHLGHLGTTHLFVWLAANRDRARRFAQQTPGGPGAPLFLLEITVTGATRKLQVPRGI